MTELQHITKSINTATGIHCRAVGVYALYFASGTLLSVRETAPGYRRRIGKQGKQLVGVYTAGVDFRLIAEDIEAFYAEQEAA